MLDSEAMPMVEKIGVRLGFGSLLKVGRKTRNEINSKLPMALLQGTHEEVLDSVKGRITQRAARSIEETAKKIAALKDNYGGEVESDFNDIGYPFFRGTYKREPTWRFGEDMVNNFLSRYYPRKRAHIDAIKKLTGPVSTELIESELRKAELQRLSKTSREAAIAAALEQTLSHLEKKGSVAYYAEVSGALSALLKLVDGHIVREFGPVETDALKKILGRRVKLVAALKKKS